MSGPLRSPATWKKLESDIYAKAAMMNNLALKCTAVFTEAVKYPQFETPSDALRAVYDDYPPQLFGRLNKDLHLKHIWERVTIENFIFSQQGQITRNVLRLVESLSPSEQGAVGGILVSNSSIGDLLAPGLFNQENMQIGPMNDVSVQSSLLELQELSVAMANENRRREIAAAKRARRIAKDANNNRLDDFTRTNRRDTSRHALAQNVNVRKHQPLAHQSKLVTNDGADDRKRIDLLKLGQSPKSQTRQSSGRSSRAPRDFSPRPAVNNFVPPRDDKRTAQPLRNGLSVAGTASSTLNSAYERRPDDGRNGAMYRQISGLTMNPIQTTSAFNCNLMSLQEAFLSFSLGAANSAERHARTQAQTEDTVDERNRRRKGKHGRKK